MLSRLLQTLLEELEVCMTAAGVSVAAAAVPLPPRRRTASARQPTAQGAGAAAPASDNEEYQPAGTHFIALLVQLQALWPTDHPGVNSLRASFLQS